ncbi:hypothetical protein C8J57DRAFT_1126950 [Mycena rebaudengoi]|nr:hypothetical protein C8J57DRAFT_1126950 [Mycena rebaudengoi]
MYHDSKDLQRTKVCRMGKSGSNEHGVLIWGKPRHPHGDPERDVRFNITLAIPTGIREYHDISTDLPRFSHKVADFFDFWSPTEFGVIRMKSSNAAIYHGSLIGEAAFIQTSNAQVEGFFGGSEKLSVKTSNSPIRATAMMFGTAAGSEVDINLETSNGAIEAAVAIMSDFPHIVLHATVKTSNAPLTIYTPVRMGSTNSSFFLEAMTSNGAANITLHPEYEGKWDLRTSRATANVEANEGITDPAGMGRQRTLQRTSTGSHAQGFMFWSHDGASPEGMRRGSVKITTSNSPITMMC